MWNSCKQFDYLPIKANRRLKFPSKLQISIWSNSFTRHVKGVHSANSAGTMVRKSVHDGHSQNEEPIPHVPISWLQHGVVLSESHCP